VGSRRSSALRNARVAWAVNLVEPEEVSGGR